MRPLGEFRRYWDDFGALVKRLAELWSVWEGIGAFERVLVRLREFWSVWEILERFVEF